MAANHNHAAHEADGHDIGHMYTVPWVQDLIRRIQDILRTSADTLGVDRSKPQKVLDYACGHGTVSSALLNTFSQASFRGLDIDASQVERYNNAAGKLADPSRMHATQGDLIEPDPALDAPDWQGFDSAITSMALHHVKDPVGLLTLMAQRVRSGGSIVVVDFVCPARDGSESKLVTLPQGEIWQGFSEGQVRRYLEEAGCSAVEVLIFPYDAGEGAPREMEELRYIFLSKAIVV